MALTLLLVPGRVDAKPLYVNGATGDDSTSYADNSSSRPWKSIGRAAWGSTSRSAPNSAEAAKAGDVVYITGGTYTTVGNLTGGGGGRWDVAYNPVNEGTVSAPIRFECTTVGACVLTYSSGAGPMIGSEQRNYIQWSGFSINESTAPTRSDTGPVTFHAVTGGSIEHSSLTGNPNWQDRVGDNYPGVRLEDAADVRIAHNVIRDFGGVSNDRNHNAVETYRSFPVTIEHNLIENNASGIYMKYGTEVDIVVIRFNRFVNNRWGVMVHRQPMTAARPMLIYQNIFERSREAGSWINVFDNGRTDPMHIKVFNNTFVDNASGLASYNHQTWQPDSGHLYRNNLVAGSGARIRMDTTNVATNSTKDRQDFDRNLYAPGGTFAEMGGSNRSFGSWRGMGQDTNGVVADPRFADANYRLAPDSPARTLGRAIYGVGGPDGTVIPVGAYITGDESMGPVAREQSAGRSGPRGELDRRR